MGDGGDERRREHEDFLAWSRKAPVHAALQVVTESPYRPLPAVRSRALVEAARCSWCRFYEGVECEHPCNAGAPHRARSEVNPRGECPHWSPAWWTSVLRCFGLGREPIMVDPKVWEPRVDA